MSTEIAPPDTLVERRLFTSPVVHTIDLTAPKVHDDKYHESLCHLRPVWPGDWLEIEDSELVSYVPCRNCAAAKEASVRARES